MSSFSLYSRDRSVPELEQPQSPSSIEPQSQQQLRTRLPNHLASPKCTTDQSAIAIKPFCPSELASGSAAISADTPRAAPHVSRLLSLPLELRQRILFFVLPYSRPDDKYGAIWRLGDTSILRTCRQFHEESTSLLYSSNTFTINVKRGYSLRCARSQVEGTQRRERVSSCGSITIVPTDL